MTRPPRTAELLLESLGAPAHYREPLLGDLAEGFASRAERGGVGTTIGGVLRIRALKGSDEDERAAYAA